MKPFYRRCAGLDIHKNSISVCIRIRGSGQAEAEVLEERFATFTQELERMAAWLKEHRVKAGGDGNCRNPPLEAVSMQWLQV